MDTKEGIAYGLAAYLARHPDDRDVYNFARVFDELESGRGPLNILAVGCVGEHTAEALCDLGHAVTGIDLRQHADPSAPYVNPPLKTKHQHVTADSLCFPFCHDTYDVVYSLSAVEHFGNPWMEYGAKILDPYADVWAARNFYRWLKPDGRLYITVPIGGTWLHNENYRRYTRQALDRLTGPFEVLREETFWTGIEFRRGLATEADVDGYTEEGADISVLLVLRRARPVDDDRGVWLAGAREGS